VRVDVLDLSDGPQLVRLELAEWPVRSDDVLLWHKHTDRQRYDRHRAARPAADDVILWNERGQVTETTVANLAVYLGGHWYTPALSCGLLPGVERARLLAAGALTEREIDVDELAGAEELAVLSSLRGWRTARLVVAGPVSDRYGLVQPGGLPRTSE
jgi:para-aminobenzoate synthetase/4-amino-4-deoxychorismate lyase